jgi:hypothetical protein
MADVEIPLAERPGRRRRRADEGIAFWCRESALDTVKFPLLPGTQQQAFQKLLRDLNADSKAKQK